MSMRTLRDNDGVVGYISESNGGVETGSTITRQRSVGVYHLSGNVTFDHINNRQLRGNHLERLVFEAEYEDRENR